MLDHRPFAQLSIDRAVRLVDGGTNGFALMTDSTLIAQQRSHSGSTASERRRWIVQRSVDGDTNERSSNGAARSTDNANPSIARNKYSTVLVVSPRLTDNSVNTILGRVQFMTRASLTEYYGTMAMLTLDRRQWSTMTMTVSTIHRRRLFHVTTSHI